MIKASQHCSLVCMIYKHVAARDLYIETTSFLRGDTGLHKIPEQPGRTQEFGGGIQTFLSSIRKSTEVLHLK